MKGIIYTRVSSDEQIKGTSLEFQEELCRKYCEQKSIEIVAVFREEGETAKDLSLNNRKKFLEALEFCRKNKSQIQAFIVLRVDRFARNTEDHFSVRKILMNYGTMLHSVTEPIGNKPAEKFIETVLAGAAEYDNALRKQRCTDGMLARINQG
ncbi:MAG: recombinase family protein, partial [Candidatus Ratteibacteria bacterium]